MDAAKARFLFGVDEPGFDPMDEDELSAFYAGALAGDGDDDDRWLDEGSPDEGWPGEWSDDDGDGEPLAVALRTIVATQVRDDDPPEVWATAQRLLAGGLDRDQALDQLSLAMGLVVSRALGALAPDGGEGATPGPPLGVAESMARYLVLLGELPVVDPDELAEVARAHVAAHQGLDLTDLRQVLRAASGTADDELADALAGAALAGFEGVHSELVALRPGPVVHLPSLTAGVVLTHRLSEEEVVEEQLNCVGSDLAAFAWRRQLRDVHRADIEVLPAGEGAELCWAGVEGWLGGARPGDALAVRVEGPGVVRLRALADLPEPAAPLVGDLRAVYDEALELEPLPVLVADLVAGVLLRRGDAFAEPQAPLVELCASAGLDVRDGFAAHDEATWQRLLRERRSDRVHAAFDGDHEPAHLALEVLDLVDEAELATPAALRSALAALTDEDLAEVVLDELLAGERGVAAAPAVAAWAARLVDVARRPAERMVAHWVAALAAERAGDVLQAERHLRHAFDADSSWGAVVDRLAWYASDRGDAPRAVELWRLLESPDPLALAAAAAAGAASAPKVGRNEPCWCGSGRKAKACHRGQAPRAPLGLRAAWLYTKAVSYLVRQDEGTEDIVVVAAAGRRLSGLGVPDADEDWPIGHPVVLDVVLHELQWLDRFLEARGPLLPEDEAEAATGWPEAERVVAEVVSAPPEGPVVLRSLRSGREVAVVGRVGAGAGAPPSAAVLAGGDVPTVGAVVCGRPLPFAGEWRLAAGFAVPREAADQVHDLCATSDGYALVGTALRLEAAAAP